MWTIRLMTKYRFLKNCNDISIDSRSVKIGNAFFAINTGINHAPEALENGASIIVTNNPSYKTEPFYFTEDIITTLAEGLEYFYPKAPKYKAAITGTNGKTSVASYFMQLSDLLNLPSASIGTMGLQTSSNLEILCADKISLTTPDIVTMYKIMDTLARNRVEHMAFEASSHGLSQKRIHGIKVQAAGFTNLTHDHLDYHQNFENYKAAKLKLFSENLQKDGTAIINSDINYYKEIKEYIKSYGRKIITIGTSTNCDLKIDSIESNIARQKIDFTYKAKKYSFTTNILGSFQANNLLMAALLLSESDPNINFEDIISVLNKVKAPKGRLERIEIGNSRLKDYNVFVDYAHTPDALEKSLIELSKLRPNRLIILFGCGGNRDKSKRPIMGKIASSIADLVIITDDNPRNEDPSIIRSEIAESNCSNAVEIEGREKAIRYGVFEMQKGDILLIAGKGHEDYQIIGDKKIHFDDTEIATNALLEKLQTKQ